MCTDPINLDSDTTIACRRCNDCLNARKNDWVARAMAEKAVSNYTIALDGMTYRDVNGVAPDGAKVFNYKHFRDFIKLLRETVFQKTAKRANIRFLVAGEYGSARKRVHWHAILFSDVDLTKFGTWEDLTGRKISYRQRFRCLWSFWPHGLVYPHNADQHDMEYILKYAFKDQFNVVRSRQTAREHKAENYGAGMFRMSKRPPIGFEFLSQYCDRLEAECRVPVSLEVNIPNYTGFWYPKGKNREYFLERLHQINVQYNDRYGRDAPQWSALLLSVMNDDQQRDSAALSYSQHERQKNEQFSKEKQAERFAVDLAAKQRVSLGNAKDSAIVRKCGGVRACKNCENLRPLRHVKELVVEESDWFRQWLERQPPHELDAVESKNLDKFRSWWLTRFRPSRGCYDRDQEWLLAAFERRKRLYKAGKTLGKITGPRD